MERRGTVGKQASLMVGALLCAVVLPSCGKSNQGGMRDGEGGDSWTWGSPTGTGGTAHGGTGQGGLGQGDGGASPSRRLAITELRSSALTKVDLLLTIDNSPSMADKQRLLAQAIPALLERLQAPNSNDPEVRPIDDLHLAVISSSLGSHGATTPGSLCIAASENDHAQLLGNVRGVTGTYGNLGFLAWDANGTSNPPGSSDAAAFADKAAELVTSAGETGCSQPATLEAWYRFLVDPEPPASILISPAGQAQVSGIDETVLQQRRAFLRPDSLLIVGVLTDANDCSLQDEGYGWLAARPDPIFRSTSPCQTNPNSPCCQSCGESTPNAGCPSPQVDVECTKGRYLAATDDDVGLRCWDQKRRYGFDLLYPVARYVDGLRSPTVTLRSTGQVVANPLFAGGEGAAPRDKSFVRLFAVAGVPWQDIAAPESLTSPESLRYMTATELLNEGRFDVILGDSQASPPILPTDPLMVETPNVRQGNNPITNHALAPSAAPDLAANAINGGEHPSSLKELQSACVFPVGAATPTQAFAEAQPSSRVLELVKQAGNIATLASVCPKVLNADSPSFGYLPAVDALVSDIQPLFRERCLPRPFPFDETTGVLSCTLVAVLQPGSSCDCTDSGFAELADTDVAAQARDHLRLTQGCDTASGPSCDSLCTCEIPRLEGDAAEQCLEDPTPPSETGYCYINAEASEAQVGNPALVASCPPTSHRKLRFTGTAPPSDATTLLMCEGASLGSQ